MKVEWIDRALLHEHPDNPKQHTPEQIRHIANSISRFGWTQPMVIDEKNTILIGHGRWLAVVEVLKGVTQPILVPVVRMSNLTPEQRVALMLVDNSTNLETGFAVEQTEKIYSALQAAGFAGAELGLIAQQLGESGKPDEDPNKLKESYKRYLEGETKRLVLYYTPEDCRDREARIDELMRKEEVPMRCDLVMNMILEYERERGLLQ